jgi:hypothetical protein
MDCILRRYHSLDSTNVVALFDKVVMGGILLVLFRGGLPDGTVLSWVCAVDRVSS